MRAAAAGLAFLVLAGCATHQEQETARDAWFSCVRQAIPRLDDGRMDPASVAYGVAPQCAVQYEALSEMMVRSVITENSQAYMRSRVRADEVRYITSEVLAYRASRRQAAQ